MADKRIGERSPSPSCWCNMKTDLERLLRRNLDKMRMMYARMIMRSRARRICSVGPALFLISLLASLFHWTADAMDSQS